MKVFAYLRARWVDLYLVFVGLVSTAYGYSFAARSHGWSIGEWLINYSGGFVRRGLLGEMILLLSYATHLPLRWLVLAVQVAAYAMFLFAVRRLASGIRWTWLGAAMLLSPATLSFILLDPPVGFKKENLFFALLGVLICGLLFRAARWRDWQISALLSVTLPCLLLTHEALILFLPYLIPPLVILRGGWSRSLRIAALPCLLVVVATGAAMLHPGTMATAETVCRSVGGTSIGAGGPDDMSICNGGIAWLSKTLPEAHTITMRTVRAYDTWWLYGLRLIPAVGPMVWVLCRLWRVEEARHGVKVIAGCAALSFAASSLLFYSASDWGRWIHIQAVCLMLLALMMIRLHPEPQTIAATPSRPQRSALSGFALAVYACCWTLPAIGMYPARTGYFGLYEYLRGYTSAHPNAETHQVS